MKEWLKGPEFVAWLEEVRPDTVSLARSMNGGKRVGGDVQLESFARRLAYWSRENALANVYSADRYLIRIGLHLSMIPDEIWTERLPRRLGQGIGNRVYSDEFKERVTNYDAGPAETARIFKVSDRTIQNWRKEAQKEAA